MNSSDRKLGDLLVDRRLVSKDDLETVFDRATSTGVPFVRILTEEGFIREEDLLQVIAERMGVEFIDLDEILLDPNAVEKMSAADARLFASIPVRFDQGRLVVVVDDPFDVERHAKLESLLGCPVRLAVAPRAAIFRSIDFAHGPEIQPVTDEPATAEVTAEPPDDDELHVNQLLLEMLQMGGSDLHLTVGSPPQMRLHGSLRPLAGYPPMRPAQLRRVIYGILTEKQREKLEDNRELDASHPVAKQGRFRLNVFFQRDAIGAVFRAIPSVVKSLDDLAIPPLVESFADFTRGLVLVTGPTGSGKSTTLASLIDVINTKRSSHIVTVEDPIEFLHKHKKSLINQREVGSDTHSFSSALRHVLRQDPDVILVGEMRDLETISTALTAAETGHLVFATLHTQDVAQTIDRIIDVFPAYQQQQVRVQLAASLQAIITQQLIPTRDGRGRTPAVEVLVATPAIRNLIREAKTHQIATALQAGGKFGMQTMDQSLADLVRRHLISFETALEKCHNVEDMHRLVGRVA